MEKLVTVEQQVVLAAYPSALACYNPTGTGFKVYKDRQTWIALSGSFPTEAQAWADAAKALADRPK